MSKRKVILKILLIIGVGLIGYMVRDMEYGIKYLTAILSVIIIWWVLEKKYLNKK